MADPIVPASNTAPAAAEQLSRPSRAPAQRALAWGGAAIVILGSLLFLAGGRRHPAIRGAAGATGEEFLRAFAETVHHAQGWHGMHMLILIGPLLWALGAPALLDAIHPAARGITSMARSALLLSGALWAVAFVLDGFGAPVYAGAMSTAGSSSVDRAVMTSFQANAIMMSRLGLVSWVAGGLGIGVLAAPLLVRGVRTPWRIAIGVSGIVVGAWPLLAALEGEYAGGPFTSGYWTVNAVAAALWYVGLASCAFRRRE